MFGAAGLTDEVVRRAAEGSPDDFARVAEALAPQIRLMVIARLGPRPAQFDAVDEVAQDVLLALTTGISRLKNRTVGGLKAFLSVIAGRKVFALLKNGRAGKAGAGVTSLDSAVAALSDAGPLWQFLSASDTSPPSAAGRAEQAARLMAELGRLEPQHREVITLAFFDQLPMSEIARRMDTSRPAASMLLIRALRTLRRNMTGSSKVEGLHGGSV